MSADDKRPTRTLGGLASRHSMPPDPSTSRLRRELRAVPEVASAITQPVRPAAEAGELLQQPTTEPAAGERPSETTNAPLPTAALPRYLQLIRKESRLRQDQADELSREVRRINQGRQGRHGAVGERITDNTLIRVAVDLLLARTGELHGTTEDELRHSVGL